MKRECFIIERSLADEFWRSGTLQGKAMTPTKNWQHTSTSIGRLAPHILPKKAQWRAINLLSRAVFGARTGGWSSEMSRNWKKMSMGRNSVTWASSSLVHALNCSKTGHFAPHRCACHGVRSEVSCGARVRKRCVGGHRITGALERPLLPGWQGL